MRSGPARVLEALRRAEGRVCSGEKLSSDESSPIQYDAEKPKELLDEDKVIGARKLGIKAENIRITPVEEVFAK